MKRLLVSILIIALFSSYVYSQTKEDVQLIVVHPTVGNLKIIQNLIKKQIIEIPNLSILGIYHVDERYDYSESKEYISNNKQHQQIELKEITCPINQDVLYVMNPCTNTFDSLFNNSQGIIFLGGPDLPPPTYGQKTNLLTRIYDPYRHYFELSFLYHLLGGYQNESFENLLQQNPDYVILGICLGMQTMNVATGGTMIQDIPNQIYNHQFAEEILGSDKNKMHRNYNNHITIDDALFSGSFHNIIIKNKEVFPGITNDEPLVYSNHHQGIDQLGKDLSPFAFSTDQKVIEGIVHQKFRNVIGIQFHPEGTYLYNNDEKYKINPGDTVALSGLDILKNNDSYKFHIQFWENFSERFIK